MHSEKSDRTIENVIIKLDTDRVEFLNIVPGGKEPIEFNKKKMLMLVKTKCFNAIHELLNFCDQEIIDKKNDAIFEIKTALLNNFDPDIDQNISFEKMDNLKFVLADFIKYLNPQHLLTIDLFSDEDSYLIKQLIIPKPGDDNILFVNEQFTYLKSILSLSAFDFTLSNTGYFLNMEKYKHLDKYTIYMAIEEIKKLLKLPFFVVDVSTNQAWMRSISFLHQLKNILIAHNQKLSSVFKNDVSESTYVDSKTYAKQKFSTKNKKKNPIDVQKNNDENSHTSIKVESALTMRHKNPFSKLLYEADNDFTLGGPRLLMRAREKYIYMLKTFLGTGKEEYIRNQIKAIDNQIKIILNLPPKKSDATEQ